MTHRLRLAMPAAPLLVTVVAFALRFADFGGVPGNSFYDAAVRSMGESWHNFFYGALEPGGQVSVDKTPIDLWLQVAATKLLGFNPTAMRLPEALGGALAAPCCTTSCAGCSAGWPVSGPRRPWRSCRSRC